MSAQLPSLQNSPVDKSVKNIEIYATLPKNKKGLLSRSSNKTKQVIEDEEYMMYERPSRSLQTKSKTNKKEGEKRARSEERGTKNTKEFVSNSLTKEPKKQKVEENKQGKKQHKIRRKLLMGGLIKRKNRSMPDLREDELQLKDPPKEKIVSKDDTMVDAMNSSQSTLSGYLSEGHLESTGNPNLLRSKLMRKSFYTNKFLHFAKVPPPPPMRTSSQLSKADANKQQNEWCSEPQSLPYIHPRKEDVTYANGGMLLDKDNKNVMITQAQVHYNPEQNVIVNNVDDLGFTLPPYPSPLNSVCHSRQPSEEFPPPPPPAPDVDEVDGICPTVMPVEQIKLEVNQEESWVKELQSKQAAWCNNNQICQELESKSIVKDLKNKFEQKSIIDNLITHAINNLPADGVNETPEEDENKIEKELKGALSKTPNDNESKRKSGKKKNVTFCEQVVLVATAEEDEVDSYIPNPILERVLRSVLHKDIPIEQNREVIKSLIPLKRNDSGQFNRSNLSLKPCYENNNLEEKSNVEPKEELPPKTYRMSPVQQLPQTLSPMVHPKLKAALPDQVQKPMEPMKNYRMSPIQQSAALNQSPLTQQKFKPPSSSQIANAMSNLSINSIDSIQSVQNQSPTAHRFYSNAQQSNMLYPQQYQSLMPMGHQKPFLSNEPHSLNYQSMNENKTSCSPVNSRSNQSSLERNQTTRQVNGVLPNCYPQHSPVEGRSGHFRYNGDSQTQLRLHGNQITNLETKTSHQYQTNPGSPRTIYSQNNVRYNVSNSQEPSGQYQNNETRTYNHGQTIQYQCQPQERLNNNSNNSGHLTDNRACYPRQPSPVQVQQHNNNNNNNSQHQMNTSTVNDSRSNYSIQTQQQFDRLNSSHLNGNDKTSFVQQGSPVTQSDRLNNSISQYNNNNCENNTKTGYLQQGVSANQAQQLERMAQHYENNKSSGGYNIHHQSLSMSQQSQQFLGNNTIPPNNTNAMSDNKSPSQNDSRIGYPPQCSPVPTVVDNRSAPGYPRNNMVQDVQKMSPSQQHSPGVLQRQRSMVCNGFHSMPYTRPAATDNVAHLPPAHPKKDTPTVANFSARSPGETGSPSSSSSSSSLDRKQLHQQQYGGGGNLQMQDGNNPTLPTKSRQAAAAISTVQRTNTVRRPMTVYEPQQLPPYQHPPAPVSFKQQQQQHQGRPNGQPRCTTPNGTAAAVADTNRYTVYQQPPSPRLQDKCTVANGSPAARPSPCNLCRKKAVNHPSIYCSDCDFYMSRFKPKPQSTTC